MPEDSQMMLEKIISELDVSKEPCLILLNNFETPWNSSTQEQVDFILLQLAKLCHISILVTMHGACPPCSNRIKW